MTGRGARAGRMIRRWLLATVWAGMPLVAWPQTYASIPVSPPAVDAPIGAAAPLLVRVHAVDVLGLARFLGQPRGPGAPTGALETTLWPGAHAELDADVDATAASFIVDHGDPGVLRLKAQWLALRPGEPADGAGLVAFVARTMRSVPAANSATASAVAATLEGDCTEHALLSAALARSAGIPARIVHGAALLQLQGRWQAYGHAWTQTYEAGRWVLRDSALADAPGPVYYLPSFVLTNEGPGYRMGLLQALGRLPSLIEVLGTADAAHR